mmetsp:Transcript_14857/g.44891  ORF Transcript_14857/g.44891 Transcript_14857/m.44891 type:complete len:398 (-) Transcript_14857:908-2101(-)
MCVWLWFLSLSNNRSSSARRLEVHTGAVAEVCSAAATSSRHAAATADAIQGALLLAGVGDEAVEAKGILLGGITLELHGPSGALRRCTVVHPVEPLVRPEPPRSLLLATCVLIVSSLGAVEAGGGPVGKQLLVVQVVRVVAGEAVPHAALLIEQPLVVHRLACPGDLRLSQGDLLRDVAVAVTRELGALASMCIPCLQPPLPLSLPLPLASKVLTSAPLLPLLPRFTLPRRRRFALLLVLGAAPPRRRRRQRTFPIAARHGRRRWEVPLATGGGGHGGGNGAARPPEARLHRQVPQLRLLCLLLPQLLLPHHLLAHVDSLASLAFGDVQSLGQLSKLIVDLHLLKPPPVRRQSLVQRYGVPLGVLPVGNAGRNLPVLLVLHSGGTGRRVHDRYRHIT